MDALTALSLVLANLIKLSEFAALLTEAHAQGRTLTDEEVDYAAGLDDAARARLEAAIKAAKGA
jgi:hypothetical protein